MNNLQLSVTWYDADVDDPPESEGVYDFMQQELLSENVGSGEYEARSDDIFFPGHDSISIRANGHSIDGHFSITMVQKNEVLLHLGAALKNYINVQIMLFDKYMVTVHIAPSTESILAERGIKLSDVGK